MYDEELNEEMKNVIDELYRQTGYSNKGKNEEETILYNYKAKDGNVLEYEGKSERASEFNLNSSDIDIIVKVITECAAYQRASQKSMMATRASNVIPPDTDAEFKEQFKDSEALIQTRQTHMRDVADISRIISRGLGLNVDFAYLTGLVHDIGHTWNGHTGERILSAIARINDCGYIVHNAMGAYILERENIIKRAINEVKYYNPEIADKDIEDFMRYVIDGVVSHNGEGTIGKIIP